MLRKFFLFAAAAVFCFSSSAFSANRTALVIGNGNYKGAPLKNPVNDARDMAQVLKENGFKVTLKTNAGLREMEEAIASFGRTLGNGKGAGLFYYAGHGIQVRGNNYLIPIGAGIETESDVRYKAVDAGRILGKMEDAGNNINIVILDACRNNPFARSFRSDTRGLAQMNAPTGSLVAYATGPGSVAADGTGRNGVYTKHLIRNMKKPGLRIEDVLKKVRVAVYSETGKQQTPWVLSSMTGDFYINTGGGNVNIVLPSSPDVTLPPSTQGLGDYDAVLEKRKQARSKWNDWQARMDADYGKAEGYDKNSLLTAEEKAAFWSRFLSSYGSDNPHGNKDENLRQKAKARRQYWQGQKLALGSKPSSVSPSTGSGGKSYTDPVTGMEFVWVQGGCYQMGDTFGDGQDDEKRVHRVCVDSFWLGKYEVTQGQWTKITGSNPSQFKKGDNYPVEIVSWDDCQSFIRKLNSRSGKSFRLPHEAEWEYAAREGGKKVRFGTGKDTIGPDEANFNATAKYKQSYSSSGQYRKKTVPVDSFSPNSLGLYNMSGNVWEWCNDWYGEDYYSNSPQNNPHGPSGGSDRSDRVKRGGSWNYNPRSVRAVNRSRHRPDDRNNNLGFRLALPSGQ